MPSLIEDHAEEYQAGPKPSGRGALLTFIDLTAKRASASVNGRIRSSKIWRSSLLYRVERSKFQDVALVIPNMEV